MELDLCLICHDDITSKNSYELPECKHSYHTECIIDWFSRGSNKCPYCSNKGVNHLYTSDEDQQYILDAWSRDRPILYFHASWSYRRRNILANTLQKCGTKKLKDIRQFVINNQHPKFLLKEFNKLDTALQKYFTTVKNASDYKKEVKNDTSILYEVAHKKNSSLRTLRFNAHRTVCVLKNYILSFPIHTLIIPITTI